MGSQSLELLRKADKADKADMMSVQYNPDVPGFLDDFT